MDEIEQAFQDLLDEVEYFKNNFEKILEDEIEEVLFNFGLFDGLEQETERIKKKVRESGLTKKIVEEKRTQVISRLIFHLKNEFIHSYSEELQDLIEEKIFEEEIRPRLTKE